MSASAAIDQYCDFVRARFERIEEVGNAGEDEPLRALMVLTLLDAMSGIAFPAVEGNRIKFCKLIEEYSPWAHGRHVSRTHLVRLLSLVPVENTDFDDVRSKYGTLPKKYSNGGIHGIDIDPSINEVMRHWPLPAHKPAIPKVRLNNITHVELLYCLRNKLVHEHREPGQGWDISGGSRTPLYHGHLDESGKTIQLVYPIGFLIDLSLQITEEFRSRLRAAGEDPYDRFVGGDFYIEELN